MFVCCIYLVWVLMALCRKFKKLIFFRKYKKTFLYQGYSMRRKKWKSFRISCFINYWKWCSQVQTKTNPNEPKYYKCLNSKCYIANIFILGISLAKVEIIERFEIQFVMELPIILSTNMFVLHVNINLKRPWF